MSAQLEKIISHSLARGGSRGLRTWSARGLQTWLPRASAWCLALALLPLVSCDASSSPDDDGGALLPESGLADGQSPEGGPTDGGFPAPRPVKVMIISMFGPEAQPWVTNLQLTQEVAVRGLSSDYPTVHCNSDDVCDVTTGMGHANAAASVSAIVYSKLFDLSHTYFLVAGIAGIDPLQGTLASAAWARYVVDYGIAWELDAREMPATWPYGYFGINTKGPTEKPPLDYRTEVFQLNEALLQRAVALSQAVVLDDAPEAQAFRAKYPGAPANQPPKVIQCDTMSGDTWYAGTALGQRARDWMKLLTDGQGVYCTTQQEDNATYEVLKRGAAAGRVDVARVAVLRTGSDFDRPYEGQSSSDGLVHYADQGAFLPAISNLYKAGSPLVAEIVAHWSAWATGVPPL